MYDFCQKKIDHYPTLTFSRTLTCSSSMLGLIRIWNKFDSSRFSLTPSRVAGATHRILWCSLADDYLDDPSLVPNDHGEAMSRRGGINPTTRTCKVDILTPNELHMTRHMPELQLYRDSANTFMAYPSDPQLSMSSESHVQLIPYVPPGLSMLLMLKLRAWVDHSLPSANEVKHGKIPQDEDDIQEILRVGMQDEMMDLSEKPKFTDSD